MINQQKFKKIVKWKFEINDSEIYINLFFVIVLNFFTICLSILIYYHFWSMLILMIIILNSVSLMTLLIEIFPSREVYWTKDDRK